MLTPNDIPVYIARKARFIHLYPGEWSEEEMDTHRYDSCPCVPWMSQAFGHGSYAWTVNHRAIPQTESS